MGWSGGPRLGSPRPSDTEPRHRAAMQKSGSPQRHPASFPQRRSALCLWRAGGPRGARRPCQPLPQRVCMSGGTTTEPLTHLPIQPPALAPIPPPGLGGRETGGPQALWAWRGCPAEHSKRVRGAGTLRRGHGPGRGAGQEAGWACRGSGSGARPPCREWPRPRGSSAQEDAVTVMDDLL